MTDQNRVLSAFEQCSRVVMRKYLAANSCISSSRITMEVLNHFGIAAVATACELQVSLPEKRLTFVSGVDVSRIKSPNPIRTIWRKTDVDCKQIHVVVVANSAILIDSTFDNPAESIGFAFPRKPFLLPLGEAFLGDIHGFRLEATVVFDDGQPGRIVYQTHAENEFRSFFAWRVKSLRPVIKEIVLAIEKIVVAKSV